MRRGKGAIVVADANASERQGLVQKFSEQDQDVAVLEAPSADLLRTILAEQPVDMLLISEQFSNNSGLDILEQLGPLVQGVITILMMNISVATHLLRHQEPTFMTAFRPRSKKRMWCAY